MVISDQVKSIYNRKKESATSRSIQFELTLEEFARFWSARDSFKCAYSGKDMKPNVSSDHDLYPTIDRVDNNKSYNRFNIVWCTNGAHDVKTRYIENGESLPTGALTLIKHKHHIDKVLGMGFDEMMRPYQEVWAELDKELEVEAAHQKKVDEGKKKVEKDIVIADMYVNYSRDIKNAGGDFLLTLSDFKKEITKKCCALTGMELPDGLPSRTLWIRDLTQEVSLGNVMVVNVKTQEALDHLRGSCKMKEEDLVMLGKGLVNLGE